MGPCRGVDKVDVRSIGYNQSVGVMHAARVGEIVDPEQVVTVLGCSKIKKGIPPTGVPVGLVFVSTTARDGYRGIHPGVDDFSLTTDNDTLSLLEADFVMVYRRSIGMSVDHCVDRDFFCRFG